MTVPEAPNSTARAPPSTVAAPVRRTWALVPVASAICEATVRFQIRS